MSQTFTIPGAPVPKERARITRRGRFTPPRTVAYERKVKLCALAARIQRIAGDVALMLVMYFPDKRRRDFDNISKSICDGLNGVAWEDDSQVKEWHGTINVDRANPRVEVWVWPRKYGKTLATVEGRPNA